MQVVSKVFCIGLFAALAFIGCTDQIETSADTQQLSSNDDLVIRSSQQLDSYLRDSKRSPLDALGGAAKARFLDSLVFTKLGLASYRADDLAALSPKEIAAILHLFDVAESSPLLPREDGPAPQTDYPGFQCAGRGSCYAATAYICTSNCVIQ